MYHESEQFYLQHRGKTVFFEWLIKARQRRRLMIIVNERFTRKQRNTLRYIPFVIRTVIIKGAFCLQTPVESESNK
jgi:hypothetical protein